MRNILKLFKNYNIFIIISILSILSIYYIIPHNNSYGDQSTENILFIKKLFEYNLTNKDITFDNFLLNESEEFHGSYLEDTKKNYYLDKNLPGLTGDALKVKAFPYIVHYITHKFFFINDFSFSYKLSTIFILIYSVLSTYLFSKIFRNNVLSFFLTAGFSFNIFVMQLLRSGMENHVILFLPMLLSSIYFINNLFNQNRSILLNIFFFSLTISISFLNGYPNTSTVLPFMLLIYTFFLFFFIKRKIFIKILSLAKCFISLLFGILIYIFFSFYWSITLGEDIYYHLKILPDRTLTMLNVLFASKEAVEISIAQSLFDKLILFKLFFTNIFFTPNIFHSPHEGGQLLGLSFFNFIEKLGFIYFLIRFLYIKNINTKILAYSFFLILILRIISNDNKIIDKDSFDFYILVIFFGYMGVYYILSDLYLYLIKKDGNKVIKIHEKIENLFLSFFYSIRNLKFIFFISSNNKNANYKINKNFFFYSILICSILINTYKLNSIFIKDFGESLREMSALSPLRNFISDNKSEDTIFIIQTGHGLLAGINRIFLLEEGINYDVYDNYDHSKVLKNFDQIYFISFSESQKGPLKEFGVHNAYFQDKKFKFLNRFTPYKIIRNSSGSQTIIIHEANSKDRLFEFNGSEDIKIDLNLLSLKNLSFNKPSGNLIFSCKNRVFINKISDIYFDNYSLNFSEDIVEGTYFIENLHLNVKPLNDQNLILNKYLEAIDEKVKDQIMSANNGYYFLTTGSNKEVMELNYEFKLLENVTEVISNNAYVLFNDKEGKGYIKISLKNGNKLLDKVNLKSNKNGKFGKYLDNHGNYQVINLSTLSAKGKNLNEISLSYKIKNDIFHTINSIAKSRNVSFGHTDSDSLRFHFIKDGLYEFINYCENSILNISWAGESKNKLRINVSIK